jgi:hypothetical protein
MRAPATLTLALAFAGAAGSACYAPQLGACEVHCAGGVMCPADLQCGTDSFCHPAGDTTSCSNAMFSVTVNKSGNAATSGTVAGTNINCGSTCSGQFMQQSSLTLAATQDGGSRFVRWTDDCATSASAVTCMLTIDGDKIVGAEFHLASQLSLTLIFNNGSSGRVVSNPAGVVDCAVPSCNFQLDRGVPVTLSGMATVGSFTGFFSPDCGGGGPIDCTEPMDVAVAVTAQFDFP